MRLWHLLVRQVSKSDNPENLIILKILVQTTARGQSTKSTLNTRPVFVGDLTLQIGSIGYKRIAPTDSQASFVTYVLMWQGTPANTGMENHPTCPAAVHVLLQSLDLQRSDRFDSRLLKGQLSKVSMLSNSYTC